MGKFEQFGSLHECPPQRMLFEFYSVQLETAHYDGQYFSAVQTSGIENDRLAFKFESHTRTPTMPSI